VKTVNIETYDKTLFGLGMAWQRKKKSQVTVDATSEARLIKLR